MEGGKTTLALLFLLMILLAPSTQAIEADELRAKYAVTLMELAENQDYAIECGSADVLTNSKLLPNIDGYPTSPAVCSMRFTDSDQRATIFSLNAEEEQSTVIAHLKDYYQPDINNANHIREDDLNLNGCDNPEELDNNWWKCPDAVEGHSIQLYYRLGDPVTYLITYSLSPSFDQSVWGNIMDFFRNLFGFDAEPILEQDVNAFTRGYFANVTGDGSREIQSFYYAENTNSNGEATIIFKNFGFDIRELANGNYQVGVDNTQVLHFDNIAPEEWKKITASLRIEPNGAEPIPGAVCGDERIDFGEACEPGAGGLSCEDLGYSFGEISCTKSCQAETSGCFNCEDADGDGYYTGEGLPNELRAVSNSIRYATMNGSFENVDAFLNPLVVSDFNTQEITNAARNYVNTYETCMEPSNENEEYDCYQEIDVTSHLTELSQGLDATLSGEACAYGEDCELSAQAFSTQATTYRQLMNDVRGAGAQPIFLLDAGDLATANFGTPPTNQNYETRLELAFTCAGLATITQTGNFIYHDKGQATSQYDRGYQACRAGMNSVGATLYYAQEPHDDLVKPNLLDGIATTNPKSYTKNKSIPNTNKGYKDLLLQNDAQLITINNNILESIEANAHYHIDSQISQGNLQVIESLEQTYASREDTGLATNIIVNTESGDDIVYISQDIPLGPDDQDFDYSSCSGTLNAVTQEGIITSDEDLANLPAGTFQYLTDWNCFLEDTTASLCPGGPKPFDCDDANNTINPGEQEICDDGIDNNCDGLLDTQDNNCVDDTGSTGEACNFDGFCSPDTEDTSTCSDCQNVCPSGETMMHTQGAYTFSAHINAQGQAQIIIESDTSSGGGHVCDWDAENGNFEGNNPKTISFNPFSTQRIQIFDNPGGDNAQVYLEPKDGGYQIRFEAQSSSASRQCWGASSDSANEYLGPVLNPFDHVSCSYSNCETQFDCGDGTFCYEALEQQIRYCAPTPTIQSCIPETAGPWQFHQIQEC